MILIKIIRPRDIPNRKKLWNWRVRLYHWVLRTLMPVYKRCAVSDTINIGDSQIIHNVRDYWFEQELQRFHINTAQHLEKQSTPYTIRRKWRRSCLFNWSDSLLVFHNGKSYNIKRDKNFSIATDITGGLKVSSDKDFVFRSEFTAIPTESHRARNNNTKSANVERPVVAPARESKPKPKQIISIRNPVPSSNSATEPKVTKHQGFEENDIF